MQMNSIALLDSILRTVLSASTRCSRKDSEMTVLQITFSLVCIASSVVTSSPTDGKLKWKEHYDKTKKSAQTANRPMLLVLENPTKKHEKIDETKLTPKERKILAQEKFELCRVDVNTDYGKRVAAAFGARHWRHVARRR